MTARAICPRAECPASYQRAPCSIANGCPQAGTCISWPIAVAAMPPSRCRPRRSTAPNANAPPTTASCIRPWHPHDVTRVIYGARRSTQISRRSETSSTPAPLPVQTAEDAVHTRSCSARCVCGETTVYVRFKVCGRHTKYFRVLAFTFDLANAISYRVDCCRLSHVRTATTHSGPSGLPRHGPAQAQAQPSG